MKRTWTQRRWIANLSDEVWLDPSYPDEPPAGAPVGNPDGGDHHADGPRDLDPRSRSIAEKRALGLKQAEIAAIHGVHPKTVWRTLKRPEVKEVVRSMQDEIYSASTDRLTFSVYHKAILRIESLLDSPSDAVAARVAMGVVDRADNLVTRRTLRDQLLLLVESIEERLEELDDV